MAGDFEKNFMPYGSYVPEIALEPCPFCDTRALMKKTARYPRSGKHQGERIDGYTVICGNMNCCIYDADGRYYTSEKEAAKIWNQRSES